MSKRHVVYPGDKADAIEQAADERGMSTSEFYTEAAKEKLGIDDKED